MLILRKIRVVSLEQVEKNRLQKQTGSSALGLCSNYFGQDDANEFSVAQFRDAENPFVKLNVFLVSYN